MLTSNSRSDVKAVTLRSSLRWLGWSVALAALLCTAPSSIAAPGWLDKVKPKVPNPIEEARKKAEEARRSAEAARQRAEETARKKAEEARRLAEAARQRAKDEAQQKINDAKRHSKFGLPGPTTLTEHGYWGGANRAPAERGNLKTPAEFDELRSWALKLIAQGRLPKPIDSADDAAMLHDIRLKWARDHVDSRLAFNSPHPQIAKINRMAAADFHRAAANPTLLPPARQFALNAKKAFQGLSTVVNTGKVKYK